MPLLESSLAKAGGAEKERDKERLWLIFIVPATQTLARGNQEAHYAKQS